MSTQRDAWSALVAQKTAKAHKYGARAKVVDGIRFASSKEAKRYQELRMLEKAGQIHSLRLQPRFALDVIGGFVQDIRTTIGFYVADFDYFEVRRDTRVVEDVKGYDVPLGRWKRRHAEAQYGITITLV